MAKKAAPNRNPGQKPPRLSNTENSGTSDTKTRGKAPNPGMADPAKIPESSDSRISFLVR
jgi:hypothetical protein